MSGPLRFMAYGQFRNAPAINAAKAATAVAALAKRQATKGRATANANKSRGGLPVTAADILKRIRGGKSPTVGDQFLGRLDAGLRKAAR